MEMIFFFGSSAYKKNPSLDLLSFSLLGAWLAGGGWGGIGPCLQLQIKPCELLKDLRK